MRDLIVLPLVLVLMAALGYGSAQYLIRSTVLDADYLYEEIDRAGPDRFVRFALLERLPENLGVGLTPAVDSALEEQRPWFLEQTRKVATAIPPFLEHAERVQIALDPAPVTTSLTRHVESALTTTPPAGYERLSAPEKQAASELIFRGITTAMGQVGGMTLDSEALPPAVRVQVSALRSRLQFLLRYDLWMVAVLGALLVVLLIAIGAIGAVGKTVLGFGLVLTALAIFAPSLAPLLPIPGVAALPSFIASYVPTFIARMMNVLLPIGFGALAIGVAGTVAGVLLKSGEGSRRREWR